MLVGSSKPLVSKLPDFAEIQAAVHTPLTFRMIGANE
jgi:hypothetical protein